MSKLLGIRTRGKLPPDAPSDAVIKKEWMKEYYGSRVEEEDQED